MNQCQVNSGLTGSRLVILKDCVTLREADIENNENSWSGPSFPIRRSEGEFITGEPSPRAMPSSLGWGTPPRMARTSARDARADPEVTTFPEVGGYDNSHEHKLSDLMLSEQPEVTVTETAGEASSNPRREKCSRIKQSYLDKFKTVNIVITKIVNIVITKIFNWGRSSVGSTIGCPSVTRKGVTSVTCKCH